MPIVFLPGTSFYPLPWCKERAVKLLKKRHHDLTQDLKAHVSQNSPRPKASKSSAPSQVQNNAEGQTQVLWGRGLVTGPHEWKCRYRTNLRLCVQPRPFLTEDRVSCFLPPCPRKVSGYPAPTREGTTYSEPERGDQSCNRLHLPPGQLALDAGGGGGGAWSRVPKVQEAQAVHSCNTPTVATAPHHQSPPVTYCCPQEQTGGRAGGGI